MKRELASVIESLTEKVNILSSQKDRIAEENRQLSETIANLQQQIEDLRKENTLLDRDNHFLILSHRLADTPEALVESRRFISALIRKIDRCITLLKDDAEL
ncbi:MAG: hypothetical protein K2G11_06490 [Muribaculaceae bacterium]|nr:hypothetical protein [Bacteroidales bacterium]MDE6084118.1 hypothetical protein [Muribaculaceae bacterium]